MGANDGDQLLKQLNLLGPLENDCPILLNSPLNNELLNSISKIGQKKDLKSFFERSTRCDVAVDLAEKMLKYDPKERLSANQCLQHPFFNSYSEIIKNT